MDGEVEYAREFFRNEKADARSRGHRREMEGEWRCVRVMRGLVPRLPTRCEDTGYSIVGEDCGVRV